MLKAFVRCLLLCAFWNCFLQSFMRGVGVLTLSDSAIIICVMPCVAYLLCWVMLQKKFMAVRIIAFILGASGVIFNIYAPCSNCGSLQLIIAKILLTVATVLFAFLSVLLRRMINNPSVGQICGCYSSIGIYFCFCNLSISALLNLLFTWPTFAVTGILNKDFDKLKVLFEWPSYAFLIGLALCTLVVVPILEFSERVFLRGVRHVALIGSVPICMRKCFFACHIKS
ncbi:hypothetical protein Ciccas_011665 [Cichlidogyrus casuarinus]|uniref:EamA domain-containing protein n=1 Tax=Cichlidogyrus casuarinus TaxID=1844966 RepID=A0ABD2PRX9_9PLAT